jgi:hypothetical protein
MTPLQASVLLNEAIELLEGYPRLPAGESALAEARARLVSFRDGFFCHIRTQNQHPVKVPGIPGRDYILVKRPVFDHTRPEGLGVLAQPKFPYGYIPSEHKCSNCREFDQDGCPNCPGFEEY